MVRIDGELVIEPPVEVGRRSERQIRTGLKRYLEASGG
jgi:hypothetical protein